jgi:hypothetical protein
LADDSPLLSEEEIPEDLKQFVEERKITTNPINKIIR